MLIFKKAYIGNNSIREKILDDNLSYLQAPSWRDRMSGMVGPSRSVQTKCLKPKVTVSETFFGGYQVFF